MNEPTTVPGPRARGRPPRFARDDALELAMRLFWTRGYEATSVSDLCEAIGVNPPSLYGAFGDKRRLFLEAVDRYQAGPGGFARAALAGEPRAERAVRRLLLEAVEAFTEPGSPPGCMVVLAATNCSTPGLCHDLAERRRAGQRAIRARLAAGADAGELAPDTDLDALAGFVAAVLHGVSVGARDGASREALRAVVERAMLAWPRADGPS